MAADDTLCTCTCTCTVCGHPLASHDGDDCGCNWPDGCECPNAEAPWPGCEAELAAERRQSKP